jgi:itaconyl-CoA hydratase
VGNYFEDFTVGAYFRHPLGRTVGAFDNRWFTLLTMNTNQLHFNVHYAEHSDHGRELVNSGLSVAMVLGLSVSDISQHAVANLGWTEIRLLHPLFVEDTLYAESLITELRPSKSRPYAGIVGCFTRGLNQDGDVIMSFQRSVMVLKREAAEREAAFPVAVEFIEAAFRSQS